MKIDSSKFVSMTQDVDSAKLEHVAITWQHRDSTPIRKFKNGDQLCTSDGMFEFAEGTGWVKKESEVDESSAASKKTETLKDYAAAVEGKTTVFVKQKDVGKPPTLGRLLKMPDDSLYLYIGIDKENIAESAGAMLVSDIYADVAHHGVRLATFEDREECSRDEHVCSCKCEGRCKDAEKGKKSSDTARKDDALAGTVDGMLSDDYKERFIAEYVQLSVRITSLNALINKTNWFMCDCDLNLFIRQLSAMINYRGILKKRAAIEKINLPECADI